jgi:hypothetical protein
VFRTQDSFSAASETVTRSYSTPVTFPEKTDIEVRAIASSSNAALHISAILEIEYADVGTVGVDNTGGFTFPVAPINAVWARSRLSSHKMQIIYDD